MTRSINYFISFNIFSAKIYWQLTPNQDFIILNSKRLYAVD
ncbi:hypothetical protein Cenrod_2077 [Candidatus Symbiobacter mobilis CR]|uniref:Uncharacterized protein n=1 Tax=Candidatus Symbiobacter mobilis CR TaxID=946483 RepID=U5ND32_9BURK|nr:hypothetical protein Cenrod_2077 [Candidatus Symbiobacter mobilis CR]